MKNRIIKLLPALVLGFIGSAVISSAQIAPGTPHASLATQTANKAKTPKSSSKRVSKPQIKPTQQPTPIPEPAPAAPAATTPPAAQDPNAAPPAEAAKSQTETQADSSAEEQPAPVKVAAEPTPEERLREQLKVVEQMVAQGQKNEALAELRLLAAEDRFDPQGFYNIANAFARLDDTDAAINAYRKAIAQRKGNYSRASNNLGVILLRQGFWDQAYDAFISALRTENFRYAEASYNLGRLYAARGEMDRAYREWRRALTVNPNHQAAASALAGVHGPSRKSPQPLAASRPANLEVSKPVNLETSRPNLEVSKPASARNERAAAKTFTLDTQSHEMLQRARTAHEKGRYLEAVDGFRRVLARNGGYFAPANLELSFSLMELRRNDEAIALLLLVAEKDGARFPISYYHLGRLYELRNDLVQAEANYLRATQSYRTENAQFLLNLSSVREKRGDFAGALAAMENYVKRKEQLGQKPDWSETRLADLRQKAAASNAPKP
jgi:tetratricopeptide (TPR) repeat protein